MTWDHKTPVSRGGIDLPANFVLSCLGCNHGKGALSFEEFRNFSALLAARAGYIKGVGIKKWKFFGERETDISKEITVYCKRLMNNGAADASSH